MESKFDYRKAAILIMSLDRHSADELLDEMSPVQSARVRDAVLELDEIGPQEQELIIEEFLTNGDSPVKAADVEVEIDRSLADSISRSQATSQGEVPTQITRPVSDGAPQTAPFRFLHDAEAGTLAKFLQNERPQTSAIVISHLPPSRAAEVMARLDSDFQIEVLQRVANLDETDPEIIREIESEIETLLSAQLRSAKRNMAGIAAVNAILNASESENRNVILRRISKSDSRLSAKLGLFRKPKTESRVLEKVQVDSSSNPGEIKGHQENSSLSVNWFAEKTPDQNSVSRTHQNKKNSAPVNEPEILFSFEDLNRLSDQSLAVLLKAADPQICLLALTGADSKFLKRLMKQLPSRESRLFQRKMEQIGPLRLRDVEEAQHQIADLASQLAAQGIVKLSSQRRLAVSA